MQEFFHALLVDYSQLLESPQKGKKVQEEMDALIGKYGLAKFHWRQIASSDD